MGFKTKHICFKSGRVGGGASRPSCKHNARMMGFENTALKQSCTAQKSGGGGWRGQPNLFALCSAFIPRLLLCFLASLLASFLPSRVPGFLPSRVPGFLPSFPRSSLPSFLPSSCCVLLILILIHFFVDPYPISGTSNITCSKGQFHSQGKVGKACGRLEAGEW